MRIIRLDETGTEAAAALAAAALREGGIVLYPTDTLYGLAVDATNSSAIESLRLLKGRERKKHISVIVESIESIEKHAHLSEKARALAQQHFPGQLTLVLPSKPHQIAEELLLNGEIGIRIPDHPFTKSLATLFGRPFTATSANRTGYAPQSTVFEIISQLGPASEHLTIVVDAGEHPGGTPSTVVHALSDTFYVIREGAISREDLGL